MEILSVQLNNMCGDNYNSVHDMKILQGDSAIIIAYCQRCKKRYYIRQHDGRTEPKYGKIFKRDTLQPHENLYYKEYPKNLKVV